MRSKDLIPGQHVVAKVPVPDFNVTEKLWQGAIVKRVASYGQVQVQTPNGFLWWVNIRCIK